ncbi:hypothetical protein J3R82DRAFT_4485, partial [Butyriboletus roseoflavus]
VQALSMTVNALGAAGDVLIAVLLCVMLHISRTGFRSVVACFCDCSLPMMQQIIVWPQTWIYIGFYFCIGRLYCNSLLATLNARKVLRGGSLEDDDNMLSLHSHMSR